MPAPAVNDGNTAVARARRRSFPASRHHRFRFLHGLLDGLVMHASNVESSAAGAQSHPNWVTEDLIRATLKVWQPYYDVPLTRDDAIGIIIAAGRLFGSLSREAA